MITNEVIIDSIATGQNIKKLMKLHNHSVAHLSKLSGLSPTTITNYRSGYNVPNLHNLCVLLRSQCLFCLGYLWFTVYDYSADSSETESFFFLNLPEVIL